MPHLHIHVLPRRTGDFDPNDKVYDAIDESSKDAASHRWAATSQLELVCKSEGSTCKPITPPVHACCLALFLFVLQLIRAYFDCYAQVWRAAEPGCGARGTDTGTDGGGGSGAEAAVRAAAVDLLAAWDGGMAAPTEGDAVTPAQSAVSYYDSDFTWESLRDKVQPLVTQLEAAAAAAASDCCDGVATSGGAGGAADGGAATSAVQYSTCDNSWEAFHQRHSSAKFFKPKRYLYQEFPQLAAPNVRIVDIGAGNGASILPVLAGNATARAICCDVSATALRLLQTAAGEVTTPRSASASHFHAACMTLPQTTLCEPSAQPQPAWLASAVAWRISLTRQHSSDLLTFRRRRCRR